MQNINKLLKYVHNLDKYVQCKREKSIPSGKEILYCNNYWKEQYAYLYKFALHLKPIMNTHAIWLGHPVLARVPVSASMDSDIFAGINYGLETVVKDSIC